MALPLVAETPIQCSTDAFYKFFKKQGNLLPHVCGSIVQTIEFADGNKSWVNTVGSRKVIEILSSDSSDTAEKIKYEVVAIDDHSRKISYKVLEGALLTYYDSFTVTLQVTSASTAKWTIDYVPKQSAKEIPDFYVQRLRTVNATVDIYLRSSAST